ncbi:Breakpoint cluster region protein [Manis javanica]|nr:Breakpoint cluster region protein [Manis javanica]
MVVGFAWSALGRHCHRCLIAKKLGANIGRALVVENKPGAGGSLAHAVANGPSDGSVLLFGSIGPLGIAPHFVKIGYDPLKDLAPITMGVNFPNVLVVPPPASRPWANAWPRPSANPANWTSPPPAPAPSHLAGELLNDVAKIDTLHVPYKARPPAGRAGQPR